MWIDKVVYEVSYYIDIVSGIDGTVFDYQIETENFFDYDKAVKYADELRAQIGDEICYWGDGDFGILKEVYFDGEPIIKQFLE